MLLAVTKVDDALFMLVVKVLLIELDRAHDHHRAGGIEHELPDDDVGLLDVLGSDTVDPADFATVVCVVLGSEVHDFL